MPIEMECPNPGCNQILTAPDELAGSKVRCPSCKTIFRLRANGPEIEPEAFAPPPPPLPPPVRPVMSPYGPGYSPYYRPVTQGKTVASLVLGIISVVPCWAYPILGILSIACGTLGVVFGRGQLRAVSSGEIGRNNEGMARAGFVCGTIGLVLSTVVQVCWLIFFAAIFQR